MNYSEDYRKACYLLGCRLDATPEEKNARLQTLVEEWNDRKQPGSNLDPEIKSLVESNLSELEWAKNVIYLFDHGEENRRIYSAWDRNPRTSVSKATLRVEFVAQANLFHYLAAFGKTVFLRCGRKELLAVDLDNKTEKWRFSSPSDIGEAVIAGEAIYFGSTDGHLYALEALTGKQIWKYKAGVQVFCRPSVGSETLSLPIGKKKIHCVDMAIGRKKWIYTGSEDIAFIGSSLSGTCCFGGKVYFSNLSGQLEALDEITGKKVWSYDASAFGSYFRTPVCEEGLVVFSSLHGTLIAFDAETGNRMWLNPKMSGENGQPIISGSNIYDSYDHKMLAAFELETGEPLWASPIYGRLEQLELSNGALYGFTTQRVSTPAFAIALDPESGQPIWMLDLRAAEVTALGTRSQGTEFAGQQLQLMFVHEGTPFFSDYEGTIYSLVVE
jgi:outer membrane protein assembly factor BamB